MAKKPVMNAEPLAAYVKRIEAQAQGQFGLAVAQISHPDATSDTIYEGTYAGIRLVKGDVGAMLSDGSAL